MPVHPKPLRIGTRGSPLALAQAAEVRGRLVAAHPQLGAHGAIETLVIRTTGDSVMDRTLSALGGKGLFTKEIEEALLAGQIDLAVHSVKDMPTSLPDGLALDCFPPREDPRDAFLSRDGAGLEALAPGAVVGTASLRRQALVLHARPDLRVVPLRGNVGTRVAKLEAGAVDATLLAVAGLKRLGHAEWTGVILDTDLMLPAVGQGALGLERRIGDDRVRELIEPLNHPETAASVTAERAMLETLDGSCRTPIAALAGVKDGVLTLTGLVIRPDGSRCHRAALAGAVADARRIGRALGEELRRRAGPGFFHLPTPDAVAL